MSCPTGNAPAKALAMNDDEPDVYTREAYPMSQNNQAGKQVLSVRLSRDFLVRLELVMYAWNKLDRIRGLPGQDADYKTWKISATLQHLANVAIDMFWDHAGFKYAPQTEREIDETFDKAFENLQKRAKKTPAKKK